MVENQQEEEQCKCILNCRNRVVLLILMDILPCWEVSCILTTYAEIKIFTHATVDTCSHNKGLTFITFIPETKFITESKIYRYIINF